MTRAAALLLLLTGACMGGTIGSPGGGGNGGSDDNQDGPDAGAPDSTPIDAAPLAPGAGSVERARLWVAAQVPYCQAANHKPDADSSCSSTCTRPDNADWDPYRSDCSGFVSWAWDLPAPGRTTSGFAPFETDLTHTIEGSDLRPGDALNNSEHIVLFEAWTEVGKSAKFMEEPGCSSATPYAREFSADVTLDGHTVVIQYHGTFTAIRYDAAP